MARRSPTTRRSARNSAYPANRRCWSTKSSVPTARPEAHDPAINIWSTKAAMPTACAWLAASVIRGKLYAVEVRRPAASRTSSKHIIRLRICGRRRRRCHTTFRSRKRRDCECHVWLCAARTAPTATARSSGQKNQNNSHGFSGTDFPNSGAYSREPDPQKTISRANPFGGLSFARFPRRPEDAGWTVGGRLRLCAIKPSLSEPSGEANHERSKPIVDNRFIECFAEDPSPTAVDEFSTAFVCVHMNFRPPAQRVALAQRHI